MEDSLAQAIIVFEREDSDYEHILEDSARASIQVEFDEELKEAWIKSGQRKTVRRLQEKYFEKLQEELSAARVNYAVIGHPEKVIAIEPMLYSYFTKLMKRAQVSGFKTTSKRLEIITSIDLLTKGSFIVNASLDMPVGKAAAQVAHAYHIFKEKFGQPPAGLPVTFVSGEIFEKILDKTVFQVKDSGLTVFSEPTVTVCYY